jgi:N-acetylglucosaminyldiphosphoundecaprenol N-acetyl-beta-D-mannosaminyltransferase
MTWDLRKAPMSHQLDDLPVHPLIFNQTIDTLIAWVHDEKPRYISTCTVYTLMRGLEDDQIFEALKQADMLTADGMPLVWYQKLQGHSFAERVYGPDMTLALCEATAKDSGVVHFFYGGLQGVPEKLVSVLSEQFPGIQVAGAFSPPVAEVGTQPDPSVVEQLNSSGASIIWVGLGSPKQDMWMHLYRPVLKAPLLIGVGAAFDFISGTKAQAPRWMRLTGLEWLFRLFQEPRRLAKRYLVYNTRFVFAVLKNLWVKR